MFDELNLSWDNKEYTVPPDKILPLIAKVEDVLTLAELYNYAQRQTAPVAKLSQAFGIMLRYAGAKATDDQMYHSIYEGGAQGVMDSVNVLLSLMVPPANLIEDSDGSGK